MGTVGNKTVPGMERTGPGGSISSSYIAASQPSSQTIASHPPHLSKPKSFSTPPANASSALKAQLFLTALPILVAVDWRPPQHPPEQSQQTLGEDVQISQVGSQPQLPANVLPDVIRHSPAAKRVAASECRRGRVVNIWLCSKSDRNSRPQTRDASGYRPTKYEQRKESKQPLNPSYFDIREIRCVL